MFSKKIMLTAFAFIVTAHTVTPAYAQDNNLSAKFRGMSGVEAGQTLQNLSKEEKLELLSNLKEMLEADRRVLAEAEQKVKNGETTQVVLLSISGAGATAFISGAFFALLLNPNTTYSNIAKGGFAVTAIAVGAAYLAGQSMEVNKAEVWLLKQQLGTQIQLVDQIARNIYNY